MRTVIVIVAAVVAVLIPQTAHAHGFSSTVYLHVTDGAEDHVRTVVELEYDLLVVSTADAEHDDALFKAGTDAFEARDTAAQAAALNDHSAQITKYVTERMSVSADGRACTPQVNNPFIVGEREGVPYTTLTLDWSCPAREGAHEVRGGLFPASEGYVKETKTIVTYDIDGRSGSAAIDAAHPTFSTAQEWYQRFWEFFRLGAEHLLTGIDHILFLLALIAGSRRLREIVLAATSFTLAHSVTFMLAALGLVEAPARVVEPVIALSIAVVAGWHLWQLRQRTEGPSERAGYLRLGIVFCFGLVHGLGFAGALGINEAWSWTLLWSLLVFNAGIEVVQLSLIAVAFPLLVLLRRRSAVAGRWSTGAIAAGVSVMGLIWFVQRIAGT